MSCTYHGGTCFGKWNYENRLRGSRSDSDYQTLIIIIRQAWKMYFKVSGVSKHKLGGMRDELKIMAGCGIRDKNILA